VTQVCDPNDSDAELTFEESDEEEFVPPVVPIKIKNSEQLRPLVPPTIASKPETVKGTQKQVKKRKQVKQSENVGKSKNAKSLETKGTKVDAKDLKRKKIESSESEDYSKSDSEIQTESE
jgi:hypothetical protein